MRNFEGQSWSISTESLGMAGLDKWTNYYWTDVITLQLTHANQADLCSEPLQFSPVFPVALI